MTDMGEKDAGPIVLTEAQIIHDFGMEIARQRAEIERLRAALANILEHVQTCCPSVALRTAALLTSDHDEDRVPLFADDGRPLTRDEILTKVAEKRAALTRSATSSAAASPET